VDRDLKLDDAAIDNFIWRSVGFFSCYVLPSYGGMMSTPTQLNPLANLNGWTSTATHIKLRPLM
jgi:hypothetical protein